MPKTREFQALLEACRQEGCLVCRLVEASMYRYLDSWKYEFFTDIDVRKELRTSQGFCHTHTWKLVGMGANIQLAQTYRDIITDQEEELQAVSAPAEGLWQRLFTSTSKRERHPCPACVRREQATLNTVEILRTVLPDSEFYDAFSASSGLCLEHLRITYEARLPGATTDWLPYLKKGQLACMQRLEAELSELIRKHDYRFRDEERGEEMASWKRAAALVAGEEKHG